MDNNEELFPTEREVTRTDNNPPEKLPQGLASAEDIRIIIKSDVEELTKKFLSDLSVYSRVPETIENDEIYQRVTTLATRLKKAMDDAENKRKAHKEPYNKAGKAIDDAFSLSYEEDGKTRALKKEMDTAHSNLKKRLSEYDTKKYNEEQERLNEERARLAENAIKDGIEINSTTNEAAIPSTVKSAHGGQSVRKIITDWEVIDENELPRSVLSIDPAKVKALIEGGATSIPGIKIIKKVDTHVKR